MTQAELLEPNDLDRAGVSPFARASRPNLSTRIRDSPNLRGHQCQGDNDLSRHFWSSSETFDLDVPDYGTDASMFDVALGRDRATLSDT